MTRARFWSAFLTLAALAVLFDVLSERWGVFTAVVILGGAVAIGGAFAGILFALNGPEVEG